MVQKKREEQSPKPARRVSEAVFYSPSKHPAPVDIHLNANEGRPPEHAFFDALKNAGEDAISRYTRPKALEECLGAYYGIDPACILVTAGADESIDRACRSYLERGRTMIRTQPTFEMFEHFAKLAEATVLSIDWEKDELPIDKILEHTDETTGIIAVVTPNNPTGATASFEALKKLSEEAPHTILLVDMAYAEFADNDIMADVLTLPNALVLRTMSKAWGMAGLRVGYALGAKEIIETLRKAGAPFPCSGLSLAGAIHRLKNDKEAVQSYIQTIRQERTSLNDLLASLGALPFQTETNFVFARFEKADFIRDALAGFGIGIRAYDDTHGYEDCLRISCPGNEDHFAKLRHALKTAYQPEAILFDMDGVLADVSRSYRAAIGLTAKSYGLTLDEEEIAKEKAKPESNNDWIVTTRLLHRHGIEATLEEVTARFEALYQGENGEEGLKALESLIVEKAFLERLQKRFRLAIVTGRPRQDAERFVHQMGIRNYFQSMICMHESEPKPSPDPILKTMAALGVSRAWMLGDMPDDMLAAKAANVLPIGIIAPGTKAETAKSALFAVNAARVYQSPIHIEEILP